MPNFSVLHYLLEFVQIHAHWISDAIQKGRQRRNSQMVAQPWGSVLVPLQEIGIAISLSTSAELGSPSRWGRAQDYGAPPCNLITNQSEKTPHILYPWPQISPSSSGPSSDHAVRTPVWNLSVSTAYKMLTQKRCTMWELELSFIWNKIRTTDQETAPQITLINCHKEVVAEGQYLRFLWKGSSVQSRAYFTKAFC